MCSADAKRSLCPRRGVPAAACALVVPPLDARRPRAVAAAAAAMAAAQLQLRWGGGDDLPATPAPPPPLPLLLTLTSPVLLPRLLVAPLACPAAVAALVLPIQRPWPLLWQSHGHLPPPPPPLVFVLVPRPLNVAPPEEEEDDECAADRSVASSAWARTGPSTSRTAFSWDACTKRVTKSG